MKVLFVLPNVQVGGVERVRLTLMTYLVGQGIECRLALRRCHGELMERAQALVPIDEIAPRGLHQFIPGLTRVIKQEQPTHLVTAFSDVGVLAWLALRLARGHAKWVHSVHNTHAAVGSRPGFRGHIHYWLENRMGVFSYRQADAVVAVSAGVRTEILERYDADPAVVHTIYNPVIPDEVLTIPVKAPRSPSEEAKIIAVGRLVRQKGLDVLIQAMANVTGSWRLDIWGEGPERQNLERLVRQYGFQDKIHLRGYTATPFDVMRNADIYVMPSRHEGLPATLIEAMACGCEPIATDCPHGPREILQDGQLGQLVAPEDPNALAEAITCALEGRCCTDLQALLERASEFSGSSSCVRWVRLLRACSQSPEQQCQERHIDELQAGIELTLAVLP